MNKEIRKVKLISKNVLDSLSYYSRLNPLYYKNGEDINCPLQILYSMKIKEQTRKLAAGCSKHRFEVVDRTDEVSSKHCFEVVDGTDVVSILHIRQGEADVV